MFDKRKRKKLETHRQTVLSEIHEEQSAFEAMAKRAQISGAVPDTCVMDVRRRLQELEQRVPQATSDDDLDDLVEDAKRQGQLRAYICPSAEIQAEGELAIAMMEEWKVPNAVIAKLRNLLAQRPDDTDPIAARSALRALFGEFDSWGEYIDGYEETMKRSTHILFVIMSVLSLLAILALHSHYSLVVLYGLFFAGAAGSCVSVMAKMPVLDVSPSGELEAFKRRIFSRISIGTIASLIGCSLLAWGLFPISIQNQTFVDMLNACTAPPSTSCTGPKALILLGVPMLFGFSERALTSFEQQVFGSSNAPR